MKALKIFVAALLLVVVGSAYADGVEIINLESGDQVNGKHFTVVAKGVDYSVGTPLCLDFWIRDQNSLEESFLKYDGYTLTSDPNLSITNELSDTLLFTPGHPITIVLKAEGYSAGKNLLIVVSLMDLATGDNATDLVVVTTK